MNFRFAAVLFFLFFFSWTCVVAEVSVDQKEKTAEKKRTVPDRDIQYSENSQLPQWKIDWDQARALYRLGKTGQALVQYELLLQKKSTVDEARWEYTTLLMQEQRWQQAGKELDTLLAHESDKRKYLLARAKVFLEEGHAGQAVRQYGQLYEMNPSSDGALEALTGLVAALDMLGNKAAQLPLLEQLLLRKPGNLNVLKQIGSLALELGQPEKTRDLVSKPLESHPGDIDLLRLAAKAEEYLGNRDGAASYRQQLVSVAPDDMQSNVWLSSYYQDKGSFDLALICIERQLKIDPGAVNLILQAAHLHHKMGHPGPALDYLSLYLDLVPDDQEVLGERNQIRKMLAADLVTLVENRQALQLWKDLKKITSDYEAVYLQIADWFRRQGRPIELTEVLLVLYRQNPANHQVYLELAPLLESQGRYSELEKL